MTEINPLMRKMVVFDMDNTVLQGRFIDACAKKYNFKQALALLRNIDTNTISLARRTGSFLQNKTIQELIKIADEIPIVRDIPEVIGELKKREYIITLISDSNQFITQHIAQKIKADSFLSYEMRQNEQVCSGEVTIPSYFYYSENSSCDHPVCKTNAFRYLCKKHEVSLQNCIVIGDSESDLCMMRHAGIGVAFCTTSELLKTVARKNITRPAFGELLEYAR